MPETLLVIVIVALIAAYWYRGRASSEPASPRPGANGRLNGLIEATVGTTGNPAFSTISASAFQQFASQYVVGIRRRAG